MISNADTDCDPDSDADPEDSWRPRCDDIYFMHCFSQDTRPWGNKEQDETSTGM